MTANATTNQNGFQPGNTASVGHGAPANNVNGLTSGVKSQAVLNLRLGQLPDIRVGRDAHAFHRALTAQTLEKHGELRPGHELAINSATRHELVCRLAVRWLRLHADELSPTEKLHFVSTMAKHSDLRDKAVERLGLDEKPADLGYTLYHAPQTQGQPECNGL
jgi:hypothetical protein